MTGSYEASAFSLIRGTLKLGDVFVDIGAHAGYYTIRCAKLLKGTGRVIAFEPNPFVCRLLRLNVSLNRLSNVTAFGIALTNYDGVGQLGILRKRGVSLTDQGSLEQNGGVSLKVPVMMLDTVLRRISVRPTVIKIDVEGAELRVIEGALETLTGGVKLVVVEVHSSGAVKFTTKLLSDMGYSVTRREKFLFCGRTNTPRKT